MNVQLSVDFKQIQTLSYIFPNNIIEYLYIYITTNYSVKGLADMADVAAG